MVRLYIIRHGDPDYDTDRVNGGSLTEQGRKEASALGLFLQKEGITHAYSSPLGRARLTARLGLLHSKIPMFESLELFEQNCGVEDWSVELSSFRVDGVFKKNGKTLALWDFPPLEVRKRLSSMVSSTTTTTTKANTSISATEDNADATLGSGSKHWTEKCPEHAKYLKEYETFWQQSDAFLARNGIHRCSITSSSDEDLTYCYRMSGKDAADSTKREARIALFCHAGTCMTLLSHLLSIPLPMVYSSFWLAPSSVTTILFEEHDNSVYAVEGIPGPEDKNDPNDGSSTSTNECDVFLTPRALNVGSLSHLAVAGLETKNSYYEEWKRPSGIKNNFW